MGLFKRKGSRRSGTVKRGKTGKGGHARPLKLGVRRKPKKG